MKIDDKTLLLVCDEEWNFYFECYMVQCPNEQTFYQYLYQLNTSEAREVYNRIIIFDTNIMKKRYKNYKRILADLKDVCDKWNYKLIVLKHHTNIEKYLEK